MDSMNFTLNFTSPSPPVRTPPPDIVRLIAFRDVFIWLLAAIGFPGNLASFATVVSMPLTSASFYVALLAVVDTLALLVKLIIHQLTIRSQRTDASCSVSSLAPLLGCYANWVLVLICFERFFSLSFPLKKPIYFTKKRVYISAAVLILVISAIYAPTFFFSAGADASGKRCLGRDNMFDYIKVWDSASVYIYFIIPFACVLVLTVLVIIGIQRHLQRMRAMDICITAGRSTRHSSGSVENAISFMLISAGLTFLALHLLACLYHLYFKRALRDTIKEEWEKSFFLYTVSSFMVDSNHAVNFFIYFLSAAKFRKSFMVLVRRCTCFPKATGASSSRPTEEETCMTLNSLANCAENEPSPSHV